MPEIHSPMCGRTISRSRLQPTAGSRLSTSSVRHCLFQAALLHERVDFEDKLRFYEVLFRIRHTEILEHILASSSVSLLGHFFLSFAMRSASRNRCLIISISRRGVSRPVFDFFWKA